MNVIYDALTLFDYQLFIKLLDESPVMLRAQFMSFIAWFAMITLVLPAFFSILMFVGHALLYLLSESYRNRQDRGTAILNIVCQLRDESKWSETMRTMVEKEYDSVQSNPSWYKWLLPQICTGSWSLQEKNKTE